MDTKAMKNTKGATATGLNKRYSRWSLFAIVLLSLASVLWLFYSQATATEEYFVELHEGCTLSDHFKAIGLPSNPPSSQIEVSTRGWPKYAGYLTKSIVKRIKKDPCVIYIEQDGDVPPLNDFIYDSARPPVAS